MKQKKNSTQWQRQQHIQAFYAHAHRHEVQAQCATLDILFTERIYKLNKNHTNIIYDLVKQTTATYRRVCAYRIVRSVGGIF